METGATDLSSCPKCGKHYKMMSALEKHVSKCVLVVAKSTLARVTGKRKPQGDTGIVKVAGDRPELVIRKIRKSKAIEKKCGPNQPDKNPTSKNKKPSTVRFTRLVTKTLLEQADQETRWQLIQCNINQILDDTLSSQMVHGLTQKLPPSNLSSDQHQVPLSGSLPRQSPSIERLSSERIGWWGAASSSLETSYNVSDSPSEGDEGTQHTPYRDRQAVGTKIRDKLLIGSSVSPSSVTDIQTTSLDKRADVTKSTGHITIEKNILSPQKTPGFSEMLDSQLFSDMNIRTADDGLVFAHKILLAATYPGIKMFLDEHITIDLSGLEKPVILIWLSRVYSSDQSTADRDIDKETIAFINSFLTFAASWTLDQSSAPHTRRTPPKPKLPKNKPTKKKQSPAKNNNAIKTSRVRKSDSKNVLRVSENNSSVVNSVSTSKEVTTSPKPYRIRKSAKRKSAHKYNPIIGCTPPHNKLSPLLSTIGLSHTETGGLPNNQPETTTYLETGKCLAITHQLGLKHPWNIETDKKTQKPKISELHPAQPNGHNNTEMNQQCLPELRLPELPLSSPGEHEQILTQSKFENQTSHDPVVVDLLPNGVEHIARYAERRDSSNDGMICDITAISPLPPATKKRCRQLIEVDKTSEFVLYNKEANCSTLPDIPDNSDNHHSIDAAAASIEDYKTKRSLLSSDKINRTDASNGPDGSDDLFIDDFSDSGDTAIFTN